MSSQIEIQNRPEIKEKHRINNLGEKNPMFGKIGPMNGKHHSDITKRKIGLKNTNFPIFTYKNIDVNFAYVLGTILTDGSIDKNLNNISLDVTDEDFAEEFKYRIEKWSGLNAKKSQYKEENYKRVFRITLSSVIIARFLKEYDYNLINDSDNICKYYFLRAVFDAEGCVEFYKLKVPYSHIRTIDITSINYNFIVFVKKLLNNLNIESRLTVWSKKGDKHGYGIYKSNLYALIIGRRKDIELFNNLIGFTIKRKQDKVNKILESYKCVTKEGVRLSWNTGLTKETNKILKDTSIKISKSRTGIKLEKLKQ